MMPSGMALGDVVRIYLKNKEVMEGLEIKGVDVKEKTITVLTKQDRIEKIRGQKASLIVVLPYAKPRTSPMIVKKRSGAIKKFDIKDLASSIREVGVDDKSAEHIAGEVKSKIVKSEIPIETEKIEEIVVDELEKKDLKTAKKFKKHYKKRK
jgi:hypothetical protein